jgi:CBS domain-containing protein
VNRTRSPRRDAVLVKDIMTPSVAVATPDETLEEAARKMEELDVGPLPVCEGGRVVGVLTDRDITVRATAAGCDPKATLICDAMTQDIVCCYEDQEVQEAASLMKEKQIRRLPVLNRANELVGIVSLGDLATATMDRGQSGEVLKEVSEPT